MTGMVDTIDAAGAAVPGSRSCGVLLIGNFLSTSGGSRGVCEELAERLPGAGFEVITASTRLSRSWRLLDMLATTWASRKRCQVAQIDVFSGMAFVWAEATAAMLKRLGTPYVLTLHGGHLPEFARRSPHRVRRLLRNASIVTTPSPYLHRSMASFRDDLELVPNPLDLHRYEYRPRRRPEPRLVWLRAFHQVYNPTLAIRTLSSLAESHGSSRLVMYGPDKRDGALDEARAATERLGVARRVEFRGAVPKSRVPHALQEGDLFLNTSRIDNAPVSVLEPMACGIPVASTNVGGLPDLVSHGEDALLVPSDDAVSMTEALRSLLEQPARAASLVERARQRVESHDWSRVLPRWRELLLRAARRRDLA